MTEQDPQDPQDPPVLVLPLMLVKTRLLPFLDPSMSRGSREIRNSENQLLKGSAERAGLHREEEHCVGDPSSQAEGLPEGHPAAQGPKPLPVNSDCERTKTAVLSTQVQQARPGVPVSSVSSVVSRRD